MTASYERPLMLARSLRVKWRNRDERYALSHRVLTPTELDNVREWRWHEAAEIGDADMMREAEGYTGPRIWVKG